MAENGTPVLNGGDVEMQEGSAPDASLTTNDPTDPQPPPPTDPEPPTAAAVNPEHLSTLQPATTTSSNAPTPSARPTSLPPSKPVAHGGPTRQYLNQNVTPHLLEAMKYLAAYEPEKPLQWLSEFLRDRSREVEGGA